MWYRDHPFELAGAHARAHLRVRGLSAGYGPFLVLRDLVFEVKPGLTVILGPNGAGKSTLLRALTGLIPRRGGAARGGRDAVAAATAGDRHGAGHAAAAAAAR